MKKVLLYGIGSFQNRGVEAIIKSTIDQMDESYEVKAATLYNYYNSKKYSNKIKEYVPHISSNSKISDTYTNDRNKLKRIQKELLEEINNNDICISLGGDNYCYNVSDWLYTIDEEVKKQEKKLILWGASLFEEINDFNLLNDMNIFDILYIRESISYDAIKNYVDERKLILCPDSAFSLKCKKVKLDKWYTNRKIIGLNLSPFTINRENLESYQSIIELIKYILNNTDYSINLIPHVSQKESDDMVILKKIKEEFKEEIRIHLVDGEYDCEEIKYIISKCDIMIASRTHASIASYSLSIPTLVIGYSVKSKGIAKDIFGTYDKYVISYKDLTKENILNNFKWLLKNKEDIKKHMKKVIPPMVKKAANVLNDINLKLEENERLIICDKNECIGCGACVKTCPVDAISFVKDELGFNYPKIDLKKCINCNKCKTICPINNPSKISKIKKEVFACKSKDENIQLNSSSGGFFSILASKFIQEEHGIIYGATIKNNTTKHIRVDKVADLKKIRGSKYTQSSLIDVLPLLLDDIKSNKKIIFSGTPCQIAGVRNLVKDYKNIYFVSVICHGVMNDTVASNILVKEGYPKNTKISYHRKDYSWDAPTIKLESNNRNEVLLYKDSGLMNLYLNNNILRESCYDCHFKGKNNVADIVMGDYWGVHRYHPNMYDRKGVSALIIQTNKGKKLLEKLNLFDSLVYEQSEYEYVLDGNILLDNSVNKSIKRYKVVEDMENNTIKYLAISNNLENEVKNLTNRCLELENAVSDYSKSNENLRSIIEEYQKEIENIKSSKRWQTVDKMANGINVILRKKR